MQRYLIRRFALSIPTILAVATITFLLLNLVPGDVTLNFIAEGSGYNEEKLEEIRHDLGLDDPLPVRYAEWMGNLIQGDFGDSMLTGRPTLETFIEHSPVTFEIGLLSIIVGALIAIPIGTIAAVKRGTMLDHAARLFASFGIAAPNFWLGTMAVVFMGLWFQYSAPPGFRSPFEDPITNMQQVLFPVAITGFRQSALSMRLMRTAMLEVLRQDYVRTAHSKGLTSLIVVRRHALRNAIIPVITVMGTQVGFIMGGTVIMETLFNLPGIGWLTLDSILRRDYTQVQTNVLLLSMLVVFANLATDVLYGVIDPRIRYE